MVILFNLMQIEACFRPCLQSYYVIDNVYMICYTVETNVTNKSEKIIYIKCLTLLYDSSSKGCEGGTPSIQEIIQWGRV